LGLPLQISGLTVAGDNGRSILSVDHLSVAPGIRVGVRGPSGAGKSTLLYALAGLIPISAGAVRWGESNVARMSERHRTDFRRAHVGMIFQDFLLFEELSALGNAAVVSAFASRRAYKEIQGSAMSTLEGLGLAGSARRNVATFSGGERQRVAIARALSNDPAIILADEPTASLDRETADRLSGDLAHLARAGGKTLIAVSHDANLLSKMDRIVDLADGTMTGEVTVGA
jgi:putative ABC transport system ATP-binding protein